MYQSPHHHEEKGPPPGVPVYDSAGKLSRRDLVVRIEREWVPPKKALLIEGQAGQGKTTFALQLLSEKGGASTWHQIGVGDGDPVRFLAVLLDLFRQFPGFTSPLVESMLAKGEVEAREAGGVLDLLLADLERQLRSDAILVLDDVYLLEDFPLALCLLDRLLQKAPPRLKLVLISRMPILPMLQSGIPRTQVVAIGNEDLALKRSEVAALFNEVLEVPITTEAVDILCRATEGWVMGMMLVTSRAEVGSLVIDGEGLQAVLDNGPDGIPEYFISEVLGNFPSRLRRTLGKLALLQEIPLDLAGCLSEVEDIGVVLDDLQRRNLFVRYIDRDRKRYAFHHLFRECLLRLLNEEFSPATIGGIETEIAGWYMEAQQPEGALPHYLSAGDFAAAQRVMQRIGPALHAQSRIFTLQSALQRVPQEVIGDYPWLVYYQGIVAANTDPPGALPWFEAARVGFCAESDELGELICLIQILHYHMAIDSRYNKGRIHLKRAAELFESHGERLKPPQFVNAANILLIAYCIIQNDLVKADDYYETGLNRVLDLDLKNLEAETRLARCYRNIFLGDHPACRREIEHSLSLLASPRVNAINKAMLLLAHLNLLVNEADHESYEYRKVLCRRALGEEIFDGSVFKAFVRLWDIDMHMAQGKSSRAREELGKALASPFAEGSAHLRSQYLQYRAYLLASDGLKDEALAAAEESLELRAEVGCPFFESFNAALIGATYAQLGMFDRAEALFAQGLSKIVRVGEFYARPTLLAHQAYWRLLREGDESPSDDLRDLLVDLRDGGFRQLWLCTPHMMLSLLIEAVRSGVEADFARKLAAERYGKAILKDGTMVPLLKIRSLGPMEMVIDGQVVLAGNDLSANQRQLLALLLSAPGHRLYQEDVQAALWPEARPARARSSFDTLVSRLRKSLDAALGNHSARHYLVLQKGVLGLENCHLDLAEFEVSVSRGMSHFRKKRFWQAENALRKGMQFWRGEFMTGMVLNERGDEKRQALLLEYLEAAQTLGSLLASAGRFGEAISACSAALKHDPTNESLTRFLYNLHVRQGDGVRAQKTFAVYSAALRNLGFSPEETEEMLESFWASTS